MQPPDRRELAALYTTAHRRLYQAKVELALCVALLVVGLVVEIVVGFDDGMLMLVGGLAMLVGGLGGRRAARDIDRHRGMMQILGGTATFVQFAAYPLETGKILHYCLLGVNRTIVIRYQNHVLSYEGSRSSTLSVPCWVSGHRMVLIWLILRTMFTSTRPEGEPMRLVTGMLLSPLELCLAGAAPHNLIVRFDLAEQFLNCACVDLFLI